MSRILAIDPGTAESAKPRRYCTPEERAQKMEVERRYRDRNREKLLERTRLYREKNRELIKARARERYKRNPEGFRERTRQRQAKDPASTLRSQRKYLYGLTPDAYERLFEQQGRACAICRTTDFGKSGTHIDHCHTTGNVRGILCGPCNRGLGTFRDEPERLLSAVTYLRRHAV